MSIGQSYEAANMGRGGYGDGGFGGSWLWFIIIFVIIFLVWGREGRDGRREGGYGDGCGIRGNRPVYYDESNWEQQTHLGNKIDYQTEKLHASLDKKFDRQDEREYQKQLTENAELKGKINTLELRGYIDRQNDSIMRELEKKPNGTPCYAETRQVFTCNPCGERFDRGERRCDC